MFRREVPMLAVCATLFALYPARTSAQSIDPFYSGSYSLLNLGSVPGLPVPYGGLTFKAGDPSKIIIGGTANFAEGEYYEIDVVRDAGNHVVGFSGSAAFYADGPFNDGGIVYGPNGVLFTARWPSNEMAQFKPGSVTPDKVVDLAPLGVAQSLSALNFVPSTFSGAGQMKLVSWEGGEFYTAQFAPDGMGTFDILSAMQETTLGGGPEGFVYISSSNPLFGVNSMLVSEYSAGKVASYEIDANGNPILATRRDFVVDLEGAEGAVIDPLTGDFLFSTFGGLDQVIVVQGFVPPPPDVPEPGTCALLTGLVVSGVCLLRRRRALR